MTTDEILPADLAQTIQRIVRDVMTQEGTAGGGNNFSYPISDLCKVMHLSREMVYREMRDGRLRTYQVGKRRYVSAKAVQDWIRAREEETTQGWVKTPREKETTE